MARNSKKSIENGFSVFKAAIILMIIGVVGGGIVVAKEMYGHSRVKKILAYRNQIASDISTFKIRYSALPGDMNNAQTFWGNGQLVPLTAPSAQGTLNGNGDGFIGGATGAHETGALWQHLAHAGVISGEYNGNNYVHLPGESYIYTLSGPADLASPKNLLKDGSWWGVGYLNADDLLYANALPNFKADNMLVLSSANSCGVLGALAMNTAASGGSTGVLTVAEMLDIEAKYDDGLPESGNVMVVNTNILRDPLRKTSCFAGAINDSSYYCMNASATGWSYNAVNADLPICAPVFRLGF